MLIKNEPPDISSMISLVPFDSSFLNHSWRWLNDPEIKALTNTPDFTPEDQQKWFHSLASLKDYLIWGIQFEEAKIGACGLKKITGTDCEYWGYIGEKDYRGRGIGTTILHLLEQKAAQMNLKSIWLTVVQDNARAISLYEKLGYDKEGMNRQLIVMRKAI